VNRETITSGRPEGAGAAFDPSSVTRPDRRLLWYYLFVSLLLGPGFPLAFVPLFFKYETLRYRLDGSGVSISWGILFRREVYLTYRRIQDIHLTRNILQRWMGLATISIQTAAGSANPEATVEGVLEAEALRDYFYGKMRGAREDHEAPPDAPSIASSAAAAPGDEALQLLREIRDLLCRRAKEAGHER
jgi:putative membrane protein